MTALPPLAAQKPMTPPTVQNGTDLVAFRVGVVALSTIAALTVLAVAPPPASIVFASLCILTGLIALLPPSDTIETTYTTTYERPHTINHVFHRPSYVMHHVVPTVDPRTFRHTARPDPIRPTPYFPGKREPVYKGAEQQINRDLLRSAISREERVPVRK